MNSGPRDRAAGKTRLNLRRRPEAGALWRSLLLGLVLFALWHITAGPNPGLAQTLEKNSPRAVQCNHAAGPLLRNSSLHAAPIRMNVDWVILPMTVVDEYGYLHTDLRKDNFQVFDDRVRQDILSFTIEDAPVAVGIIFDTSNSMKNKMQKSREAALRFFQTSNPEDVFMLVAFSARPYWISDVTGNYEKLLAEALFVQSQGETALLDAIYEGLVKLSPVKTSRKALVVISDGADNHSRYTYRDVKKLVRESNVQIYTVGVFEPPEFRLRTPEEAAGPGLLAGLANISGGRSYSVYLPDDIPDITTQISDTLRSQYVVGYVPSNLVRDGRWRRIRIKLRPPGGLPHLQVYTRSGYYAPTH